MGEIPSCRLEMGMKPFHFCEIDYAGPLHILPYRRRGVRSIKSYICLFIYLVTKAVHIELASDLSTESFLSAFKRILSRRGPVGVLYSDCGTNFVGAKSYLDNLYKLLLSEEYNNRFTNELRDKRIEWKLNPPSAPHFGGIWESNVRCVKMHLLRVVGNKLLTYEEVLTVLVQIEAILHSRPLSAMSCDPSEPLALTPTHFLTLTPLTSLPARDFSHENVNLLQRKRIIDHLVQSFWKRWQIEYLHTLQTRHKWTKSSRPIEGTVTTKQCYILWAESPFASQPLIPRIAQGRGTNKLPRPSPSYGGYVLASGAAHGRPSRHIV
ncbi:hypothetical protein EVAR_70784_1 [Eumeta japonica]|uniref:Integrase catalytic domain-containing protein n=1 Tax=Eumeta variegata TaxID=151549 RepID=A0A4C1SEW9_EUMVA|nr:hypothetical protein EVAR_70784_1 [Eumeta japonica]